MSRYINDISGFHYLMCESSKLLKDNAEKPSIALLLSFIHYIYIYKISSLSPIQIPRNPEKLLFDLPAQKVRLFVQVQRAKSTLLLPDSSVL